VTSIIVCVGDGTLILFEDEHLLVVNKPGGWNTHAPSAFASEGVYDWLRHREPRWASLAIIHRLDKETSGVLVFSKTTVANRSLTRQFAQHTVRKSYVLLTSGRVPLPELVATSTLVRAGPKYLSQSVRKGERAETRFRVLDHQQEGTLVEAEPITGRTHQIRVHAAEHGFAILGDTLYGGAPFSRVCLHARALTLQHPASSDQISFEAPADFRSDPRWDLRACVVSSDLTDAFRLVHGAADGWPEWYVDRLGEFLFSQSHQAFSHSQREALGRWVQRLGSRGAYHKIVHYHGGRTLQKQEAPVKVLGEGAPSDFVIRENGVRFALSFREGHSVGLFLDQRDNRRRLLVNHVAANFPLFPGPSADAEVLNTFAYTCGFSVCAAKAGARVTSIDLSKKYLDWGRRNFALNALAPVAHDFIHGDTLDWLRRLAKKQRAFDVVILDPPTFSRSKEHGVFQVEKDYGRLVTASLAVLKRGGVLLACTNAALLKAENFIETITTSVRLLRRVISRQHYVPQPPDFPMTREEPGYLKTIWLRVE